MDNRNECARDIHGTRGKSIAPTNGVSIIETVRHRSVLYHDRPTGAALEGTSLSQSNSAEFTWSARARDFRYPSYAGEYLARYNSHTCHLTSPATAARPSSASRPIASRNASDTMCGAFCHSLRPYNGTSQSLPTKCPPRWSRRATSYRSLSNISVP